LVTRAIAAGLVLIASTGAAAADPAAPRVRHVPMGSTPVDQPVQIIATVDRAWQATLELHYRAAAAGWRTAQFELGSDGDYRAILPAAVARPPGFDYYIASVDRAGARVAHFASAADPHRVMVVEPAPVVDRRRELQAYRNRRARVQSSFEWVDFGRRRIQEDASVPDHYYRVEVDASFRVLRFPLHTLRFGYTRLLGTTPETERGPGDCMDPDIDDDADCKIAAGLRAGGWVELRFRVLRALDIDVRGMVQATQDGFNVGTRNELRIGSELGSHVALGVEAIADIGTAAFFRLGWDTVPGLPMAATIELTDFPASHRASGLRLIYDIAHPMDNGIRVGLRAGYQARDQRIGGVALGGSMALDFDFGGGTR
jgi:hypothetical protein